MNYFELFNLPEKFDIDLQQLKLQYQTLQKVTHPDRVASSSVQEKRIYLQKNADINNGFTVLKSPVMRGEHILENRGFELADEQQTMGDTAFLMQQMMLRESLADAKDTQDFNELEQQIYTLETQLLQTTRAALSKGSPEGNEIAADALTKLKFLVKLELEASEKADEALGL